MFKLRLSDGKRHELLCCHGKPTEGAFYLFPTDIDRKKCYVLGWLLSKSSPIDVFGGPRGHFVSICISLESPNMSKSIELP